MNAWYIRYSYVEQLIERLVRHVGAAYADTTTHHRQRKLTVCDCQQSWHKIALNCEQGLHTTHGTDYDKTPGNLESHRTQQSPSRHWGGFRRAMMASPLVVGAPAGSRRNIRPFSWNVTRQARTHRPTLHSCIVGNSCHVDGKPCCWLLNPRFEEGGVCSKHDDAVLPYVTHYQLMLTEEVEGGSRWMRCCPWIMWIPF